MTQSDFDDIHPKHARNKMLMAVRIGDQIMEKGGPLASSEALAEAGDATWSRIAFLLDEARTPSPATRAMVVAYIETVEAKMATAEALLREAVSSMANGTVVRAGSLEDFLNVLLDA